MSYYLQVATFICVSGILGLSVYLVLSTGQLTLGNAGFMLLGGYTAGLLAIKLGWPLWLTVPAGGLLAAVVAVPLGAACLRLRGVYLAVATLGFTQSLVVIANNLTITGGALGLKDIPNLGTRLQRYFRGFLAEAPFGLTMAQFANLVVLLICAALLGLAFWLIVRQGQSRVGRAFTAIRTDEVAASAMGINTTYYKVLAFAQGAFLAGVAGGLMAHLTYFIGPADFGFSRAVEMLVFVVVGGTSVPAGPVLGAALLRTLSEYLREAKDLRLIIYGALMLLMVLVRPQGLLTPGMFAGLGRWWQRRRAPGKGAAV
ncbi:MAG: ABC-type branched-chain amino acid transport system, permease component [Symbiobacteriaceae bacterium]|jgi:branched-chain amino acid transport system permease protein|nr:ABC-type branched-chain amino acid transport system, permease component [Symbiobacteriaceae bacterium]